MKRSLITWDERELPRSTLESRLERLRAVARSVGVPVMVVYSDVWRSNLGRALVNFMPFWSRSLLAVPSDAEPVLICGHSPRVFPWIRTVTLVEDIRPGKHPTERLFELAAKRRWKSMGVVDLAMLPFDLHTELGRAGHEIVDVSSKSFSREPDANELAMRRTGVELTRRLLERSLSGVDGRPEREVVARLERSLRGEGMEDLVIWMAADGSAPRPPSGRQIGKGSSVVVASEYRGHWTEVSRPLSGVRTEVRESFLASLGNLRGSNVEIRDLGGPFPFRACSSRDVIEPRRLLAVHLKSEGGVYYGDTCLTETESRAALL